MLIYNAGERAHQRFGHVGCPSLWVLHPPTSSWFSIGSCTEFRETGMWLGWRNMGCWKGCLPDEQIECMLFSFLFSVELNGMKLYGPTDLISGFLRQLTVRHSHFTDHIQLIASSQIDPQ